MARSHCSPHGTRRKKNSHGGTEITEKRRGGDDRSIFTEQIGRRQRWTRQRFNRGGRRGTRRTPNDDLTTPALCVPLRPPRLIRRRQRWTRQRFNRGGRRGTRRTPDDDLTTLALCVPLRPPRSIGRRQRRTRKLVNRGGRRGTRRKPVDDARPLVPAERDAVAIMPSPDHPAPLSKRQKVLSFSVFSVPPCEKKIGG